VTTRRPARRPARTDLRILTVLVAVLLLPVVLQPIPVGADTFTFSGDRTEVVLTEGREYTLLEGNAVIVSDQIELRANRIELSGTDFRYAETRGDVVVYDAERDLQITAETVYFDRETENSRAEGGVIVEDRENELLLKGEYLETREGGDVLFVQSAVRVLKEDLTARAQFLRYRRTDDTLELSGFPVVFWKGDEYRAIRIIMNLETEEIEMQGQVQGAIIVEDPDEEEDREDPDDSDDSDAPDAPDDAVEPSGETGPDGDESDE